MAGENCTANGSFSIVLVGLGSIGKRHLANLSLLWPHARIYVVSASERLIPPAELGGHPQLTLDQAVQCQPLFAIIASPAHLHLVHAGVFSQAGIPVLVEKPLADQLEHALEFIERIGATAPLFSLGYCLRYLPSAQQVQQLLAANVIGPLYLVQATVGQHLSQWRKQPDYRHSVSAQQALGGGALLELSHELDYLLWLFGPLQVEYCHLRRQGELMLDVEESADLMLLNNAALVCQLHVDFLQQVPQRRCVVTGQQGRIEWDLLENSVHLYDASGKQQLYHQPQWDKNQMYLLMLQDFVSAISQQRSSPIPLQDGLAVLQIIHQAKQLAEGNL